MISKSKQEWKGGPLQYPRNPCRRGKKLRKDVVALPAMLAEVSIEIR